MTKKSTVLKENRACFLLAANTKVEPQLTSLLKRSMQKTKETPREIRFSFPMQLIELLIHGLSFALSLPFSPQLDCVNKRHASRVYVIKAPC